MTVSRISPSSTEHALDTRLMPVSREKPECFARLLQELTVCLENPGFRLRIGVCRTFFVREYRRLPDQLSAIAGPFCAHRLRSFGLQMLRICHRESAYKANYKYISVKQRGERALARLLIEFVKGQPCSFSFTGHPFPQLCRCRQAPASAKLLLPTRTDGAVRKKINAREKDGSRRQPRGAEARS